MLCSIFSTVLVARLLLAPEVYPYSMRSKILATCSRGSRFWNGLENYIALESISPRYKKESMKSHTYVANFGVTSGDWDVDGKSVH